MNTDCQQPCDADCEVASVHCIYVHLPKHKRAHDPDQCPAEALA